MVAGVEEGGRRGARGGRRWELRSGEGRPGAGRPAAWRAGGEVSGGGGKEPSAGTGRREKEGFWADVSFLGFGPLPKAQIHGPRQRCFYFLKKNSLPSAPSPALGKSLPSAKMALGKFSVFFCFFDPKFFVGPAYIVYNFMFKFDAFSSFFCYIWLINLIMLNFYI